jgi:hypothetical protein
MVCPHPFLWSADTQGDPSRQAILVPNARDSDRTALAQRRPDWSSPAVGKKPHISSASDYRDSLSRERSTLDVRNIHDLRVKARFRTRALLANVPTRCRKVYVGHADSCTAPAVNDSLQVNPLDFWLQPRANLRLAKRGVSLTLQPRAKLVTVGSRKDGAVASPLPSPAYRLFEHTSQRPEGISQSTNGRWQLPSVVAPRI